MEPATWVWALVGIKPATFRCTRRHSNWTTQPGLANLSKLRMCPFLVEIWKQISKSLHSFWKKKCITCTVYPLKWSQKFQGKLYNLTHSRRKMKFMFKSEMFSKPSISSLNHLKLDTQSKTRYLNSHYTLTFYNNFAEFLFKMFPFYHHHSENTTFKRW